MCFNPCAAYGCQDGGSRSLAPALHPLSQSAVLSQLAIAQRRLLTFLDPGPFQPQIQRRRLDPQVLRNLDQR